MEDTSIKDKFELIEFGRKWIVPIVSSMGFLFYVIHFGMMNYFPSVNGTELINVLLTVAAIGLFYSLYFSVFSVIAGIWLSSLKNEHEKLQETLLAEPLSTFILPALIVLVGFICRIYDWINDLSMIGLIVASLLVMTSLLYRTYHNTSLIGVHISISILFIAQISIAFLLIFNTNIDQKNMKEVAIFGAVVASLLFAFVNYMLARKKLYLKDYLAIPIITMSIFVLFGMGKNFVDIPFKTMGYANYRANAFPLDEDYLSKIDFNVSKGTDYVVLNSLGDEYYFTYIDKGTKIKMAKCISKEKIRMESLESIVE